MNSKPILFCDFDGTICFERYWSSLPPDKHEKVQELLFRGDKARVSDWMRGKYTAEEINEWVAEQIGMPYDELWQLFVDDCRKMRVSQQTLEKLASLRDRYSVILMTGNMDSFSRFTAPQLQLEKYFDHVSNSYYEGKHKTDNAGEIFSEYASKWNTTLANCVLLDDSLNVCTIFEALGGKAFRVTPNETVDHYLTIV